MCSVTLLLNICCLACTQTCSQHQSLLATRQQHGALKPQAQQQQQQHAGLTAAARLAAAATADASTWHPDAAAQGPSLQQQQQQQQRQSQWHHACSSLRTYEGYGQSLARPSPAVLQQQQQQQQFGGPEAMVWSPAKSAGMH